MNTGIALWILACAWGGALAAHGAAATNSTWISVLDARTRAEPLLSAGDYRAAASIHTQARMRSRDPQVKAYLSFAADLCQLRDAVAKGRPGIALLHLDFDDGVIPDLFRDGRENLTLERVVTFGGSPGALTVMQPTEDKFLLAESHSAFECTPDTVMVVCVYGSGIAEAKFQLNTDEGTVHYFYKGNVKDETWTPMFFRLALDGSTPIPLGTRALTVSFVAQACSRASFAVLDEWQIITHP